MEIEYTTDFNKALLTGNKALQKAVLDEVSIMTGKPTFIQGPRFGYAVNETAAMYVSKVVIE